MATQIKKPQAQTDQDIHPLIAKRWEPQSIRGYADCCRSP